MAVPYVTSAVPAWVAAANRGEVPFVAQAAAVPFQRDRLVADALVHQGLDPADRDALGGDDVVEPLDVLTRALEDEAGLTTVGRWFAHRYLRRLLTVRIQLHRAAAADPGLADEVVVAPLFVVGAPRTGTTHVFATLAQDPHLRAPEGWELLHPVPAPRPEHHPDPSRVAAAAEELDLLAHLSEGLSRLHAYSARMPKECLSATALSFRSEEFISRFRVPGYVAWLQGADMAPAYQMHRKVLQVLQRHMAGRRWLLKSPVHLQALPELLATYPDARLVITHRDPLEVLASVTNLVATLRRACRDVTDPAGDRAEIAAYHADLYGRSLDRLVDHDDAGRLVPGRVVHVHQRQLLADTAGVMGRVYAELDLPGPAPVGPHVDEGPSAPDGAAAAASLAALGLDPTATGARFARYQARWNEATIRPR